MLTLKEIKATLDGLYDDIELYVPRFRGESHRDFHTDFIKPFGDAEAQHSEEQLDALNITHYQLMDEEDYNHTVYANNCNRADFLEWYDDADAKVLVCLVEEE